MKSYQFTVCCVRCGGPLTHVNGAHPSCQEATAVVWCGACKREWLVALRLVELGGARRYERNVA